MLKAFRFGLRALSFLILAGIAHAEPDTPAVVVDAETGEVLFAEEATRPWFPASTTKLMTAYVALREVQRGNITLDTPIVASANATRQPPSKIGIKAGQEITLGNALKILMVKSANDVATIVAEGIGGSVPTFVAVMNREAARLGMRESHFANPHGLHREDNISSARDMAILARALLLEMPHYRGLWGIGAVRLGNRKYTNTNGLIGRYPGTMGMKTGFICPSGFNLVSAAERGGRKLIAVVFGASSGADRTLKAAQLLDQGFGLSGGFQGGGARSLEMLPASFESAPPNRRSVVCGRGRAPASEEDSGETSNLASGMVDNGDTIMNPGRAMPVAGDAGGVGARIGGRVALEPRAPLEAIEVHLGREPGSTALARRAGGGDAAKAFAGEGKRGNSNPLALTEPMIRPALSTQIGGGARPAQRPAASASLHSPPPNRTGTVKAGAVKAGTPNPTGAAKTNNLAKTNSLAKTGAADAAKAGREQAGALRGKFEPTKSTPNISAPSGSSRNKPPQPGAAKDGGGLRAGAGT